MSDGEGAIFQIHEDDQVDKHKVKPRSQSQESKEGDREEFVGISEEVFRKFKKDLQEKL